MGGGGARYRKYVLWFSIVTNLGILGFFKYFNFFADSFERVIAPFGLQADFVTLNIILPVGISFYTFQTMAYTIDVYRGKEKACTDFIDFALYVCYFPQLVAGPIERAGNLIPQFAKARNIDSLQFYNGIRLIFWGFFKKIFIADGVAPYVNDCFTNPSAYSGGTLLLGAYLFAIQIYGDFSGYTDIARGVSRLFGIELCLNFRQPYLASNITDFWRRWHISLSSWLRDYLYIPLGGNRNGKYRTYINVMLTMLLGGLWHGAALTFIVWGALHGLYLAVHKAVTGKRVNDSVMENNKIPALKERIAKLLGMIVTFHLVCFAWIFFRANTLPEAFAYLSGILRSGDNSISGIHTTFVFYMICVFLMDTLCERYHSEVPVLAKNPVLRGLTYAAALFMITFIGGSNADPFIYFQF
ncbi:MAG: MBOAT family protein [Planctomycetaceae bacterium]|jgi:D-alanyl-lipoteichoic acid acyltransferase DltB (MBOAT superfamily)|nr:MBOAT family protein [Planctomycetaceae bacterium]